LVQDKPSFSHNIFNINSMYKEQIAWYKINLNENYNNLCFCVHYIEDLKSLKLDISFHLHLFNFTWQDIIII
jgi:hypothetical protein